MATRSPDEPREAPPTPIRLAPELDLPPYAYVPGRAPHPSRSPDGHRHGRTDGDFGRPPDRDDGPSARRYLHVLDLLNLGYYWEAHEALESWWRQSDPTGPLHPFYQGLLRIAAAGVKALEGRPAGARRHGERAVELLREAARRVGGEDPRLLGLELTGAIEVAQSIADGAMAARRRPDGLEPDPVLGLCFRPDPRDVAAD